MKKVTEVVKQNKKIVAGKNGALRGSYMSKSPTAMMAVTRLMINVFWGLIVYLI